MLRNLLLLTFGSLFGMLALAYFTTDTSQREAPDAAVVADLFDRLAFQGYGEQGPTGQGPYLRRWTQPVRMAVIGGPEEDPRLWSDGVEAMAEVYDVLPGLDISMAGTAPFALEGEEAEDATELRQSANLVVWTVPEDQIDAFVQAAALPGDAVGALRNPRGGCAVVGAEAAVLSNVAIVINGAISQGRQRTCLGEKMAMALGFYIPEKIIPDVFRNRNGTIAFHPLGRMAAGLAYDPALEPGMPRANALDAVNDILKSKGLK